MRETGERGRVSRWALTVALLFGAVFLVSAGGEAARVGTDLRALAARPSAAAAWRTLGRADFEDFMVYCRARIPAHGVAVAITAQPASGYYRAAYDLYPRRVWPYVSPLGLEADAPHPLTRGLLAEVLGRTHAGYLVVWRAALPRPLPPHRWVGTFGPDELVVALR